jgi:aerobic C4-dicarboxylate transport protein
VVARWQNQLDRDRLREVLDNPSIVDVDHLIDQQHSGDGDEKREPAAVGAQ